MRKVIVTLLTFFIGIHVFAQRDFMLEARGGFLVGGLRDEMYSPLNYTKVGFAVGLGGEYRFGKSHIELQLGYGQARLKTDVTDYFNADFYGARIAAAYLHNVWQPSSSLALWVGGGYTFGLEGLIWEMESYSYIANHSFDPIVQLDWNINRRHLFSTRFSTFVFGFISRPPYNYIVEMDDNPRKRYFFYLMRELGHAKFAVIGRYWDVDWTLSYHYRIARRYLLGVRYGFRFQRYRSIEPVSQFDNMLELSFKVRL